MLTAPRIRAWAMAILIAGCSQEAQPSKPAPGPAAPERAIDPETSRLEAGSAVVSHRIANIGHPDGREWRKEDKESVLQLIDADVELVVLDDAGDENDPRRKVRATLQEGNYKGRTYLIARRDLRPKP